MIEEGGVDEIGSGRGMIMYHRRRRRSNLQLGELGGNHLPNLGREEKVRVEQKLLFMVQPILVMVMSKTTMKQMKVEEDPTNRPEYLEGLDSSPSL
jgi:hypothetical protein